MIWKSTYNKIVCQIVNFQTFSNTLSLCTCADLLVNPSNIHTYMHICVHLPHSCTLMLPSDLSQITMRKCSAFNVALSSLMQLCRFYVCRRFDTLCLRYSFTILLFYFFFIFYAFLRIHFYSTCFPFFTAVENSQAQATFLRSPLCCVSFAGGSLSLQQQQWQAPK